MFRKLILIVVMSIPMAGAMASHTAVSVVVVMGMLIFLAISVSALRDDTMTEPPTDEKT